MIEPCAAKDPLEPDRLVVIATDANAPTLVEECAQHLPDWRVVAEPSYLSAIAHVATNPPRAIIAWVDPAAGSLSHAIGGLRAAVGPKTKLLLCCLPQHEPIARRTLPAGADDYVLFPLVAEELTASLDCPTASAVAKLASRAASFDNPTQQLARFNSMLDTLSARPIVLIEKAAGFVLELLPATGVSIVVEGAIASAGSAVTKPVLSTPIQRQGRTIGQIMVGPPTVTPYAPHHVDTLTHCAAMVSRLLETASRTRHFQELAMTDVCTGLPNRRYFLERIEQILAIAGRSKLSVTLLLFDVDNFKRFNDEHGHDIGDQVLTEIGRLFTRHCREQDVVSRFGGDEFAVVFWDAQGPRMPGSRHPQCAFGVLNRVKQSFSASEQSIFGQSQGRLTISGGLATYPWDATTKEDLIKKADQALIAAKKAGKNRIHLIGDGDPQEP